MRFIETVRAQMKLAWHARTAPFLLFVCMLPWPVLMLLYYLINRLDADAKIGPELLIGPGSALIAVAIGTVAGILMWRDEPPRTRFYHWSMPVDTTAHDLARVVAYGAWLVIGISCYIAVGAVIMIAKHVAWVEAVGVMPLIGAYMAAFIGFFIAAAYTTAFEKPLESMLATYILFTALGVAAGLYRLMLVRKVMWRLVSSANHYSLVSAIINAGKNGEMHWVNSTAQGRPVAGPLALWLTITLLLVIASSFYNRGRAR